MPLIDVSKTERVHLPEDANEWYELRRLFGTEVDEARQKKIRETIAMWGDQLNSISKNQAATEETLEQRIGQYDSALMLQNSIVAWSHPDELTPDNINRLDAPTRQWLLKEVVERNIRPLATSSAGGSN